MTTITVDLPQPAFDTDPVDLYSHTRYADLPRKGLCEEQDGDGVSSTDPDYPCGSGCDEPGFAFVVEPGDTIPMQFMVEDRINEDPEHPAVGWRYDGTIALLEIEVLDIAGAVLWSGNTQVISASYHVGATDEGPYQNIVVSVNRLLSAVPSLSCWFFRVKVYSNVPAYVPVNASEAPSVAEVVPAGYAYLNLEEYLVVTLDERGEWDEVVPETGTVYYVAEAGLYYEANGSVFVPSSAPPPLEAPTFSSLYTRAFRLRHCDEPVVRISSVDQRTDCLGFFHGIGDETFTAPYGVAVEAFQHDMKVSGSCEVEEYSVTKEFTRNRRTKSIAMGTRSRLRTAGMPQDVARRVQVALGAADLRIDGEQYEETEAVKKNNDDGSMWYIDAMVSRVDCDTDTSCA